jgi:hypothetical protein
VNDTLGPWPLPPLPIGEYAFVLCSDGWSLRDQLYLNIILKNRDKASISHFFKESCEIYIPFTYDISAHRTSLLDLIIRSFIEKELTVGPATHVRFIGSQESPDIPTNIFSTLFVLKSAHLERTSRSVTFAPDQAHFFLKERQEHCFK